MTRFLLLALLLASSASAQTTTGVFVGNQGNGSTIPASLTYLDRAAGTAQQLPIRLGGFLQSTELLGGRLFVTGNGTKIDVLDPATRQRVAQITDATFSGARYFAQVGPDKAYVTTQEYGSAETAQIVILNTAANTVAGRIAVPKQPETLAVSGASVYAATVPPFGAPAGTRSSLLRIDPATDLLVTTTDLGCTARFLLADDDGELFAVCTDTGEIVRIDGTTGAVVDRLATGAALGSNSEIGQDAVIGALAGDEPSLYVLTATGVLVYGTDAHTVSRQIAITDGAALPASAIGIDPQRNQLILGRPNATQPFTATGTVTVHAADGAPVASFPAGLFPTHVSVVTARETATASGPDAGGLRLEAPAPNPATASAAIRFTLDAPTDVRVSVFDVLGREVARVASGTLGEGEHRATADVRGLPAGVYVVRLTAGARVATQRLTVAR